MPLFEALRAWRRERRTRQHVPPYVIFHDATLAEIARERPATRRAGRRQRRRRRQARPLRRGGAEGGARERVEIERCAQVDGGRDQPLVECRKRRSKPFTEASQRIGGAERGRR